MAVQHSPSINKITTRALALLLATLVFAVAPSQSSVRVEGHLPGTETDGRYDFDMEVRTNDAAIAAGRPRVFQSIRKVMVTVIQGRFQVDLYTGLEAYAMDEIEISVSVRAFETHGPFMPVVVSRFYPAGGSENLAFNAAAIGEQKPSSH